MPSIDILASCLSITFELELFFVHTNLMLQTLLQLEELTFVSLALPDSYNLQISRLILKESTLIFPLNLIHSKNVELINSYVSANDEEVFKQNIITNFNKLFAENPIVHKLTFDEKISIMKWRASQPSGLAVPLSLQFSRKSKIGFCGDWFEGNGFGRIEGSILSALILEKKIKDLIK